MSPDSIDEYGESSPWQSAMAAACLAITAGLGLAAVTLFYLNRETVVPPSWGSPAGTRSSILQWANVLAQGLLLTIVPALLGFFIVRRRPGQRVGWLLLLAGFLGAVTVAAQEYAIYGAFTVQGLPGALAAGWIGNWSWIFLFGSTLMMLAIFPDGYFLSGRWRAVILACLALFIVPALAQAALTTPMQSAYQLPNPFFSYENTAFFGTLFNFVFIFMPLSIILILGELAARFRRSRGRERQQMKWLLAGMGLMALMAIVGLVLSSAGIVAGELLVNVSTLAPMLAIGVALLRYRLYDIDIIIRRGLVYALLTVLLIAIYFGVVLLAQSTLVAATGHESPLAIVVSTLVIAALFNPLRQRVQAFIDRRFYRSSYDAANTLARFAQSARSETDLQALTAELSRVVKDTMQPQSMNLWLAGQEISEAEQQK